MQFLLDEEFRKARKDELHHIMADIRDDHLPPTSKRPNQPLRKKLGTGAKEAWWFAVHLGMYRSEVDVHERDGFVVRDVVSFVGVQAQGDPAIKVFGGGVEDDPGHGCFVGEGSDEYDESRTSTSSCAEGWKESPGQEQREEGVRSDLVHVLVLRPSIESVEFKSRGQR
jgi:hypothetical protein